MLRIMELREAAMMTRAEFAERVGVSVVAVFKWEHGYAVPLADKLPLIARTLGVRIDELYREGTTSA